MNDSATEQLFERLPDPSARTSLFEAYQPLARHVAGRYAHRGAEILDLRQVAGIGLLNAIDRYDPRHGSRFTTFAVPTIAGEIKHYFRDNLWGMGVPRRLKELRTTCDWAIEDLTHALRRIPTNAEVAAYIGVPVSDVVEVTRLSSAYRPDSLDSFEGGHARGAGRSRGDGDDMGLVDETGALDSALASLPPLQQTVLELRFSFEMTQSQIAAEVGVSQMQVSRLLRQALDTLRTPLARAS